MQSAAKSLNNKLFTDKLASSGLTIHDAKNLHLELEHSKNDALIPGIAPPFVRIHYLNQAGTDTGFYRIRLLAPPKSFVIGAKQTRYLQPPGTGVAAYFPAIGVDWPAIMRDSTATLYVTEGELKAACACKHGLPTIGLGGVYSWRSAKAGVAFLPELEAIAWTGRHVFLVFDSDAQTNHNVMRALRHLARELTNRGALPYIAKLPALEDVAKTGLDDFIVHHKGIEQLQQLFDNAETYQMAAELWKLNDVVCMVRDPGFVLELSTGMRMSVMSFVREVYANLFYEERVISNKTYKLVKKPTAAEWIKWQHRLEAQRLTYAPGAPRFTAAGELNTWRGSGIVPVKGSVKPWHDLLEHIFDGQPHARQWFERWAAYPLQRPGMKLLSAAVIWGVHQGTGKSLIGYTLARLYGEHNVSEITQEHLRAPYNDWLVDKQLIMGEEITGSDRRADADKLKAMITQKTVRVNAKYIREYPVPSLASFFFSSNHPDAFFLEDTDRRFFVHEVKLPPKPMAFYRAYVKWYESDEGAAAMLHYMLNLDLGDFDPEAPAIETDSKREMINDNKSDLAAWVLRLRQEPAALLAECGMPKGVQLLTTQQLLAMYDPVGGKRVTTNGMGRELKRSMVPRLPVTNLVSATGHKTTASLYAVIDADSWLASTAAARVDHWMKFFGKAPAGHRVKDRRTEQNRTHDRRAEQNRRH